MIVDIDIESFLDELSHREITREVIPWLRENNYIEENDLLDITLLKETEFDKACRYLIGKKHLLTKEQEELIIKLSKDL